jgi:hypothetical protein
MEEELTGREFLKHQANGIGRLMNTFVHGLVDPLARKISALEDYMHDQLVKRLDARLTMLESKTISSAESGRVASIEERLVHLEKRVGTHDSRHDAHKKHLDTLELKFGKKLNG